MYERKVLPFYMTYPLPVYYEEEDSIIRDLEYLQQMYPSEARRYQKTISSILDKLDYEGSMIYDEYPDRLQLRLMSGRIYDRVKAEERPFDEHDEESGTKGVEGQQLQRFCRRDWLRDLIDVMLYQELYKRRSENRRMRQKFY